MNETILNQYNEEVGCRFFRKQKDKFIKKLIHDFQSLGYKEDIVESRKMFSSTKNVVFGDLKQAKTIICVPYDTPIKVFSKKYNYYPFDIVKSQQKAFLPTFVPLLLIYLVAIIALEFVGFFIRNTMFAPFYNLGVLLVFALLLFFAYMGIPNEKNANMYTASVVCALSIATALTKEEKKSIAFVFTDKNKKDHYGDKILQRNLVVLNRNPNVICLSTIGNGKEIAVGYNNSSRKIANTFVKCVESNNKITSNHIPEEDMEKLPISYYQKSIIIACGNRNNDDKLVVENVQNNMDTNVDVELISCIEKGVLTFIKRSI